MKNRLLKLFRREAVAPNEVDDARRKETIRIVDALCGSVSEDDIREGVGFLNNLKLNPRNAAVGGKNPANNTICYLLTDGSSVFGQFGSTARVRIRKH